MRSTASRGRRKARKALRIVIKPDLQVFHRESSTGTDPRLVEHLEAFTLSSLTDGIERVVHDRFRSRLLAAEHDHVDEFGDLCAAELWIRQNIALRNFSSSGHSNLPLNPWAS